MQKDTQITDVQFWKSNDADEFHPGCNPFAYFSNESEDGEFRLSYSRVGQHSSCHPDYLDLCTPATPEEYAPLKEELESIGYILNIIPCTQ